MSLRISIILASAGLCMFIAGCQSQKKDPAALVVTGGASTDAEAADSTLPRGAVADLPTLEAEQKARQAREIEEYKKQTGFTQIDSSKGAEALPFMQGGFTQTPDGTASIGVAGVGATLKDAHDAAIIAAQRQMMRNASIAGSKVVIAQGAFRKLADGWQVFVQGQSGPGAVVKVPAKEVKNAKPAPIALPEVEKPGK